jgi:protein TonB
MITQPHSLSLPVGSSSRRTGDRFNRKPAVGSAQPVKPIQPTVLTEPVEIPDKIADEDFFDIAGNNGNENSDIEGALESTGNTPGALPGNGSDNSAPIHNLRVEQIPRLIKKVTPLYPEIALKARIMGKVIIEAETDIYGRVTTVKVISGPGLLTDAAVEAVKKWVYEPYIINGFPRPVRFTVNLEFTLKHR